MAQDLDDRVLRFACRAVDIYGLLEARGGAARELVRRFLRAATSIGANCAEAAAGQSKADFIAKIAVARKEAREAVFWLRLMQEKSTLPIRQVAGDLAEARQLTAILRSIVRKARASDVRGAGIS